MPKDKKAKINKKDEQVEDKILADKYLDNWKRAVADLENYKKDQVKLTGEFRKFASLDVLMQILPVLDNFNVSLEHVPEDQKDNGWVTGIIYIKKQLEDVLKNNGVEEIEVRVGDEFNPSLHEAMTDAKQRMENESTNKIRKIVQRGYKIDPARNASHGDAGGGKVIRVARVIVG